MKSNAIQRQQARPLALNAHGNALGNAAAQAAYQEGTQQNTQSSTMKQDTQGSVPRQKEVHTMDALMARKEEDDTQAAALVQQAEETRPHTMEREIQARGMPLPQGAGVILLENQAESGESPCPRLTGTREEEAPTQCLILEEQFDTNLVGEVGQQDEEELSLEGAMQGLARDKVGTV